MLAGSQIEAISPVAISPNDKAIYRLRTQQILLYRTSHTGAMRYRMLLAISRQYMTEQYDMRITR